jgi:hypothetical protein
VSTGTYPTDVDVTEQERRRLDRVQQQAGRELMRELYVAWRLTKVLSLLPFTCGAVSEDWLGKALARYWNKHPATSFYFIEECLEVVGFLRQAILELPGAPLLLDVLAFDEVRLAARAGAAAGHSSPEFVRLSHEPAALLRALREGGDLNAVPPDDVELRVEVTAAGEEVWSIVPA